MSDYSKHPLAGYPILDESYPQWIWYDVPDEGVFGYFLIKHKILENVWRIMGTTFHGKTYVGFELLGPFDTWEDAYNYVDGNAYDNSEYDHPEYKRDKGYNFNRSPQSWADLWDELTG